MKKRQRRPKTAPSRRAHKLAPMQPTIARSSTAKGRNRSVSLDRIRRLPRACSFKEVEASFYFKPAALLETKNGDGDVLLACLVSQKAYSEMINHRLDRIMQKRRRLHQAATLIQKVVRGFKVRRNTNRLRSFLRFYETSLQETSMSLISAMTDNENHFNGVNKPCVEPRNRIRARLAHAKCVDQELETTTKIRCKSRRKSSKSGVFYSIFS